LLNQVRVPEATEAFRRALALDPTFADARTELEERVLHRLNYRSDLSQAQVFAAHRDWGTKEIQRAAADVTATLRYDNTRNSVRALRIAYVGVEVGSRLVKSCLEPLLAHHDAQAIVFWIYAAGSTDLAAFRQ